jgi:hypothetical protein
MHTHADEVSFWLSNRAREYTPYEPNFICMHHANLPNTRLCSHAKMACVKKGHTPLAVQAVLRLRHTEHAPEHTHANISRLLSRSQRVTSVVLMYLHRAGALDARRPTFSPSVMSFFIIFNNHPPFQQQNAGRARLLFCCS